MKRFLLSLTVAITAASALLPQSALAWHSRASVGVYFGGPIYGPGYYYGPSPYYWAPRYYYPPPVVTVPVPVSPPVYVEQGSSVPAPASAAPAPVNPTGYWYYCRQPAGYYPSVPDCPAGWQRVAPLPAQ